MNVKDNLHLKYRPDCLEAVIGQDHVVHSLQDLLKKGNIPHAFLFTGGSGMGKTTLSRIIAKQLGCLPNNILEIDAATHTGVDAMRDLCENLIYSGIGHPVKFVIMDECHMLSKSSWNSLLKILEEPPSHVFFTFLTTEVNKVPETIKTRCHAYHLRVVKNSDLIDLLDFVCDEEKFVLDKTWLSLIANKSDGSPRKALVYLSQIQGCASLEEVSALLEVPLDIEIETINLCRSLMADKPSWAETTKLLKVLVKEQGKDPESLRIQIVNYITACTLNAKSEKETEKFLVILSNLSTPFSQTTGLGELLVCLANIVR